MPAESVEYGVGAFVMVFDVLVTELNVEADTDVLLRCIRWWYMDKSKYWASGSICVAGVIVRFEQG